MQRLAVGTVALATLWVTSVFAADMAVKAPPPPPPPACVWCGWYVGVNAGGSWNTSDVTFDPVLSSGWQFAPTGLPALSVTQGSPSLHGDGFIGGGQAGYNYQTGNVVIGIEADIDYWGVKLSRVSPTFSYPGAANYFFTESVSTNWLATVRPRVGVALDHALFYGTGGLAVGNQSFAESLTYIATPNNVAAGTISQTKVGWTAGGGLEYAFTNQWSAKLEYLYVDLGSVGFTSNFSGVTFQNLSSHLTADIVRGGINYHF